MSDADAAALQQGMVEATTRWYEYARKLEARNAQLAGALKVLVERVEMDESVGVCLTSRTESLNAQQVLREGGYV